MRPARFSVAMVAAACLVLAGSPYAQASYCDTSSHYTNVSGHCVHRLERQAPRAGRPNAATAPTTSASTAAGRAHITAAWRSGGESQPDLRRITRAGGIAHRRP